MWYFQKQEKEKKKLFGYTWNIQILSLSLENISLFVTEMKVFLWSSDFFFLSSFFNKKFGNIMCQNWSAKLKTQQIHVLFMGFPLFFISENFHFCCNENYQNDVHSITSSVWHGFVLTTEPSVSYNNVHQDINLHKSWSLSCIMLILYIIIKYHANI